MTDDLAVPPSPGSEGNSNSKVPKTPAELRAAIERGELAGDIVFEGEAAKELEKRRKMIIRAGELTSGRLQQAAKDLEAQALDPSNSHELHARHAMMSDALAFRRTAEWLHVTDHPEAR